MQIHRYMISIHTLGKSPIPWKTFKGRLAGRLAEFSGAERMSDLEGGRWTMNSGHFF